jgi:hypothetical protein
MMMMLRVVAGAPTGGMRVHFIDRNVWTTKTTLPKPPRQPGCHKEQDACRRDPPHTRPGPALVQRVSGPVHQPRHLNGGRDDGSIESAAHRGSAPRDEHGYGLRPGRQDAAASRGRHLPGTGFLIPYVHPCADTFHHDRQGRIAGLVRVAASSFWAPTTKDDLDGRPVPRHDEAVVPVRGPGARKETKA